MGIGTSRVHPIKQTGLMANNIVVGRTSLAAVPTPTPTPRVPAESVNEAGAPIAPTSNGPCPVNPGAPVPTTSTPRTNYPVPPFGFNKFTFPSRQSNLVTPKVKINLRTPSCCLRRTTVRVQPKQNDISSSEVIHISDDSLKDGDMIVDTPTEKIFMSKVKRWQIFPGNTKFWFDGRFIHGPDRLTFYASFAVVQFIYGGFAAFVLPFLMGITPSFVLPVITAFSYNSVVSTMLYCAYTDPGIIPRATKSEIENYRRKFRESGFSVNLKEEINGKVILRKWCHTCLFYKPPRATHCRSCDTCVERFDHHCPFIGNCVGQRNYPTFFMFLVSVLISCLYVTGCCCGVIAYEYSNDVEKIYSPDKPTVASWIVGIASFAVFVAVGFLFGLHIGLISQDLTTNEDYKFDGRGDNNPYNQHSIWKNWCQVLLTPRLPTLIQRRAYVTKEFLESLYYQDAVNDAVSKKYGAAKDSPDPEPPYDPNRFKIKSNGKDGKPDYPRAHYHVYPPPGPPNNKDVANSPSTQMNNNASMNHQNHLGQGPNPSPADSQQVYTNSLINPNNWTDYSSQQQQESHRASGFQLELQNTEKFDSLSDTFNNSGGYPLAQVSIQDQDQQLSRQSSGPSLPFTISKETVLVERIFSTQLISPSPSQSFPGSNTETISLPINTTHLSSQSICRSFSCTQPTVVSYAGDFNKNPATNTYSSPTTDDIIIGVQIQTRESVRL